ncbi:MAG: SpoIIE family protein phosphatase [Acidobacteriia bacterium]|nr:SpoIIE family protein phosphatase [Terriglobia bacterium]
MGRFTLLLLTLWLLRLLLPSALQLALPQAIQSSLALVTVLLAVPAIYYAWKILAVVRGKLLWKIRRRLIVAHILIAAIPLALVVVILYVSGLLFYYQLSYYLIEKQIGIHTAQISAFNQSLSAGLQQVISGSQADPMLLRTVVDRDAKYLLGMYRTASIVVRVKDPASGKNVVYAVGHIRHDLPDYQVPRWITENGFSGLVYEDVQPAIYEGSNSNVGTRQGHLFLRSLVFGDLNGGIPYSLEVSVPLDGDMLDRLRSALGQDLLLADNVPNTSLNVMLQDTGILSKNILYATFDFTSSQQSVGGLWSMPLYPFIWSTGEESKIPADTMLFVELSPSKLFQNVFNPESNVSRTFLGALEVVVGFFLAVELLSLIGGILLTKSITSAVHNLDRGTEFIRRGDFSHRIVVKSDDQLGALAKSFNQMTEYVQTLVKERVQKERLERELEIAKEVQEQLFPKQAPKMKNMELTGLCLPARIVSGDYYDFLQFDDQNMGLAVGDICGKGISAALLMANLQATLRSNVLARGAFSLSDRVGGNGNVAGVVKVLNQQIYSFTSANKFASFFYAVYDDFRSTLTYTNAGHNPPLYFSENGFRRLTTGGTVVGIFPDAEFEQETIQLQSGDILLAYTDGIIESVNEYGEEFGEQRLIDLVRGKSDLSAGRLQKAIVNEVLGWAFEEERDDDMTLIVARFR